MDERSRGRAPMLRILIATITTAALAAAPAVAASVHTTLRVAAPAGLGAEVGTVTIKDSQQGAIIMLDLHGVPPGQRGMHVHEKGSCAVSTGPDGKPIPAGAAGGHFDPARSGRHMGSEGQASR